MKTKTVFYVIGVLALTLIAGFLVVKNYAGEQNKPVKQEPPKEDMIIVYKKGKEIKLLSDCQYFRDLKNEIEKFALTADSSYKLIVENKTIKRIRAKRVAIELFYALPKEVKVDYLDKYLHKDSITIKNILIPLSREYFPEDIAFLFVSQEDFYLVANTKQTKDNLLKLIESLN